MTAIRRSPLHRTRIGAVPFLNAIPLIYGLEDRVQFFQPARLSEEFDAARIDVGLLPIVEYFKADDRLLIPRIAIGCQGEVRSVKLFLNKPIKDLKTIAVDSRSRTSVLLLRVLLELHHKIKPQYIEVDVEKEFLPTQYDGLLLIGDQALNYKKIKEACDLGSEWARWTGLPFVFAAWQVRRGFSDHQTIRLLEEASQLGQAKIDYIASLVPGLDQGFVKQYLSQCLCYSLEEDQEHAIELFIRFLTQLHVPVKEKKLEYVDRRDLSKGLIRVSS